MIAAPTSIQRSGKVCQMPQSMPRPQASAVYSKGAMAEASPLRKAWVIASWLVSFGIIDRRNQNARAVLGLLSAICEPMCRPLRRLIPPINGVLDLSPLLVILIIVFVRDWAIPQLIMLATGGPRIR